MYLTKKQWIGLGMGVGAGIAGVVVAKTIAARRRRALIAESITIARSLAEVSRLWERLEPLKRLEGDGDVRFAEAPGGRGTEVRVERIGAGALGAHEIKEQLRRFKAVIETGDVVQAGGAA